MEKLRKSFEQKSSFHNLKLNLIFLKTHSILKLMFITENSGSSFMTYYLYQTYENFFTHVFYSQLFNPSDTIHAQLRGAQKLREMKFKHLDLLLRDRNCSTQFFSISSFIHPTICYVLHTSHVTEAKTNSNKKRKINLPGLRWRGKSTRENLFCAKTRMKSTLRRSLEYVPQSCISERRCNVSKRMSVIPQKLSSAPLLRLATNRRDFPDHH